MSTARLGRLLLALGLLVGVAASVGLFVGFEPARLPPALLNIAAYKLTFLAALGLLAGGATFLRHAKRETAPRASSAPPTSDAPPRAVERPRDAGVVQGGADRLTAAPSPLPPRTPPRER